MAEPDDVLRQRFGVAGGGSIAALRVLHRFGPLAGDAGQHRAPACHIAGQLGRHRHAEIGAVRQRADKAARQRAELRDAGGRHAAVEGDEIARPLFLHQLLQRGAAHAVAHQQQTQICKALLPGDADGPDHRFEALGRAEIAGEHQPERLAQLFLQRRRVGRPGVEILAVLRDHRDLLLRLFAHLGQAAAERTAHGDQAVGAAVVPVAHRLRDGAQRAALDVQHRIEVFRPDVQHIVGQRHAVQLRIQNGGKAHQHRAGVIAQHSVVFPLQARQAEQREQRPRHIVEKDHRAAVALAGDLAGADELHAVAGLAAGAGVGIAREPVAQRIVGQTAQHVHLHPAGDEALAQVGDAEIFRPVVLAHNKDTGHIRPPFQTQYLRQTILFTTPT